MDVVLQFGHWLEWIFLFGQLYMYYRKLVSRVTARDTDLKVNTVVGKKEMIATWILSVLSKNDITQTVETRYKGYRSKKKE